MMRAALLQSLPYDVYAVRWYVACDQACSESILHFVSFLSNTVFV
jgi:hypothetical protein